MKKRKKIFSMFLVLALLISTVLVGCSSSGESQSSVAPSSGSATSNGSGNQKLKANLRILYPGTTDVEKNWAATVVNKLHETQPDINVE